MQTLMSVLRTPMVAHRSVPTLSVHTSVAVILATVSTLTDTLAMVSYHYSHVVNLLL